MAASISAMAQPASMVDLELNIAPALPTTLRPGSTGTLDLSVTNHGPDTAGASPSGPIIIVSSGYLETVAEIEGRAVYFGGVDSADSCIVYTSHIDPPPPQGPLFSSFVRFGAILAGETQSCRIRYTLNPRVAGTVIELPWDVQSPVDTDPNPANNTAMLAFAIGSRVVGVPGLSIATRWMEICLLLLVGLGVGTTGRMFCRLR